MAMEGLMSHSGDPFSDGLLMYATRLLVRRLPESAFGDDAPVRSDLMFASLMCGHGTDYTGAGIAIPLGHAISAKFHIDNGITNAIVLPHVVRFNQEAARPGVEKLASAFGCPDSGAGVTDALIGTMERLFAQLRIPARLRDAGVPRESLPELTAISMEDWFVRGNPRRVQNAEELQQVLESAW
jgi:alcohol dehydrogenase class IV